MAEVIKNNLSENLDDIKLTDDLFERVGTEGLDGEKLSKPSLTYWADVWRRFKGNKLSMLGLGILAFVIFFVAFGPMITGYDYTYIDASIKNQWPSAQHWFGTDSMGRDLFTRTCVGGVVSIQIGLACTAVMFVIGSIMGAIAGFKGGIVDTIIMRLCEIISSIPNMVLVIIISVSLGRSNLCLILAMSLTSWIGTTRMVRGQILQIKELDYIAAAIALGADTKRIILKHLLPNTLGIIMVDITMSVPAFIFSEATLSYLGLGVQPPKTSWGALANAAKGQLMFFPYQLFLPCLFIIFTILAFHLIGDGLTDALDPKLRK